MGRPYSLDLRERIVGYVAEALGAGRGSGVRCLGEHGDTPGGGLSARW